MSENEFTSGQIIFLLSLIAPLVIYDIAMIALLLWWAISDAISERSSRRMRDLTNAYDEYIQRRRAEDPASVYPGGITFVTKDGFVGIPIGAPGVGE